MSAILAEEAFVKGNSGSRLPEIDFDEAEEHIRLLGATPETKMWLETLDDVEVLDPTGHKKKKRDDGRLKRQGHGVLASEIQRLSRWNARGAGVFVAVNEIGETPRPAKNNPNDIRPRRVDEAVTRIRAVWGEFDAGGRERLEALPLEPTFVIESSPGKFHAYWVCPDLPFSDFDGVMARLVQDHGSDNGAKDRTRILRLAGSWHRKNPDNPWRVCIVEKGGRVYSRDEIVAAFPPIVRDTRDRASGLHNKFRLIDDEQEAKVRSAATFLQKATDGAEFADRQTWLEWGMALHEETGGLEQGFALWNELSRAYCQAKYDEADQIRKWESLRGGNSKGKLTLGTIYKRATDLGWKYGKANESAERNERPGSAGERKAIKTVTRYETASQIEEKPVEWLWPEHMPLRASTLVIGQTKVGKSQFGIFVIARVTTGKPFPRSGLVIGRDVPRDPATAVLITAEDDIQRVVIPRLKVAGADLSRVRIVKGYAEIQGDGSPIEKRFSIGQSVEALTDLLESDDSIRLIVIDPVNAYLGGKVDAHRNNEVRDVLQPLKELAEKYDVAVLLIHHMKKGQKNGTVTDMSGGSNAFVEATRAVFAMAREPGDSKRFLLELDRSNFSEAGHKYFYRIDDAHTEKGNRTSRFTIIEGERLGEALEGKETGGSKSAVDEAVEFLNGMLGGGEVLSNDIRKEAKAEDIGWGSVKSAKAILKVRDRRIGFGPGAKVYWSLPPDDEARAALASMAFDDAGDDPQPPILVENRILAEHRERPTSMEEKSSKKPVNTPLYHTGR